MDLPQEPPAIIYQQETLEQKAQAPYNSPYFDRLCRNWGHALRWFIYHNIIPGKSRPNIEKLKGKQVLHSSNHLSWADVMFVPYNHWQLGLDETIKIGRANTKGIPHVGNAFTKNLFLTVPYKMNLQQGRPYIREIHSALDKGLGFTIWAEGTRSRDGEMKELQVGTLRIMHQHAVNQGIDLIVSPEAVVYDEVIEKPFFWLADFFKNYTRTTGGKWCYEKADILPFATRFLKNRLYNKEGGTIIHAFGEPFSIHDCKNEIELKERVREGTSKLKIKYQAWLNIGKIQR